MSGTRYRSGAMWAMDMTEYSKFMEGGDNKEELTRAKYNLLMALRQEVPPAQRKYINMYYVDNLNMKQIGEALGVDKSTVARTIKRGEANLRRCLRFGGDRLLAAQGAGGHYGVVKQRAKREGYENC